MGQCAQWQTPNRRIEFNDLGRTFRSDCRAYVCEQSVPIKHHLGNSTLDNAAQKLIVASRQGDLEGVRMALECGSRSKPSCISTQPCVSPSKPIGSNYKLDPDTECGQGTTALMYAAREGHVRIVGFLLESMANPNSVDPAGMRPLHFAAMSGSIDVCKFLVHHGAAPLVHDDEGFLPFDWIPSHLLESAAGQEEWESVMQVNVEEFPNILGRVKDSNHHFVSQSCNQQKVPRVAQNCGNSEDAVLFDGTHDRSEEAIVTPVSPIASGFGKNHPWKVELMPV